jgi:hypothetical protein
MAKVKDEWMRTGGDTGDEGYEPEINPTDYCAGCDERKERISGHAESLEEIIERGEQLAAAHRKFFNWDWFDRTPF